MNNERGLVTQLCEADSFIRQLRTRMRFGPVTRVPLRLLRPELQGKSAECDLLARSADVWDADLPPRVGKRHASLQAVVLETLQPEERGL